LRVERQTAALVARAVAAATVAEANAAAWAAVAVWVVLAVCNPPERFEKNTKKRTAFEYSKAVLRYIT
jgi:hypothetical protein